MFRPMTYAPRGRISQPAAVASASLARSSPRCQECSSRPPLPSGCSRLWSGPATKPSSEIDMWQVVSGTALDVVHRHAGLARLALDEVGDGGALEHGAGGRGGLAEDALCVAPERTVE